VQTARGLAHAAGEATGRRFRLLRAGGLGRLDLLIRITRAVAPARDVTFPPWQGMQYLRDMAGGRTKLAPPRQRPLPRAAVDDGARGPRGAPRQASGRLGARGRLTRRGLRCRRRGRGRRDGAFDFVRGVPAANSVPSRPLRHAKSSPRSNGQSRGR
jgi:hypothetical protein